MYNVSLFVAAVLCELLVFLLGLVEHFAGNCAFPDIKDYIIGKK